MVRPTPSPEPQPGIEETEVNVLCVDDDARNLLALEATIGDLGARLVMARSGREALRAAFNEEFAVIILDVNMPDMDGFETAALLRGHPSFAETPLIFSTAYAEDLYEARAYALGAVDYILNPSPPAALRAKIKVFVDLHRAAKRIEYQAEALRRRTLFLATVSHELRTPLNVILSWADLLAKDSPDPATVERGIDVIQRNARRQLKLVDELIDVSRRAATKPALELRMTSMHALLDSATQAMRPVALQKGVSLGFDAGESAAEVEIDVDRMHQVISNLLTNAIKFTPAGGRIDVTVHDLPDSIELRVRDNGNGISPEFLPFVFDRFRQENRANAQREHGLGMGLSLVREITELHGGAVRVESAGTGHGAMFVVRLPRLPTESDPNSGPLVRAPHH